MKYNIKLNQFTSREAEEICEVSMTQQRNWRRYGFLPPIAGHARMDLFDLCELYSLNLLTEKGVAPKQAVEVIDMLAIGLAWHTLTLPHAYEGDALLFSGDPLSNFEQGLSDPLLSRIDGFARGAFRQKADLPGKGRLIPARFFIWFADGSHTWDNSIEKHFNGDKRTAGAVIVLDQLALGAELAKKTEKAFASVSGVKTTDA